MKTKFLCNLTVMRTDALCPIYNEHLSETCLQPTFASCFTRNASTTHASRTRCSLWPEEYDEVQKKKKARIEESKKYNKETSRSTR